MGTLFERRRSPASTRVARANLGLRAYQRSKGLHVDARRAWRKLDPGEPGSGLSRREAINAARRAGAIELSDDLRRAQLRYEPSRVITLEQTPQGWRITALE